MLPHLKYLFYVLQHKWYVFIECCKLGIPLAGITHDLSKFTPREWKGYVAKFFWPEEKKTTESNNWFMVSWNHHQNRNMHHWDYWLHRNHRGIFPLPMPRRYLKEMLADWRAMSRKFKTDPLDWYRDNRDKIQLRDGDRAWIEDQLGYPQ